MRVTFPTRPWMVPTRHDHGGRTPVYAHAVSYVDDEVPVALCTSARILATVAPELPPCPLCVGILTAHGLWPL